MTTQRAGDANDGAPDLGFPVPGWTPPPPPAREAMHGRYCDVEPLQPALHGPGLFASFGDESGWTYLPYGPFDDESGFTQWLTSVAGGADPLFHAIVDRSTQSASGLASYLRITPAAGSIEVGHIHYSPALQRTRAATEAMYLMMRRVFELGYRRYEWKCNALNRPSRNAAMRFGFSYEGVFRQALVVKGRNRDTAWYACIDREWPALRRAYERWLSPDNFDAEGRQRVSLSDLTRPLLAAVG